MMADAAKKRRTQAKKNYTRALNIFNTLLAEESPADLVKPQFDKLTSWWDKLEAAQDEYVELNNEMRLILSLISRIKIIRMP